MNIAYRTDFDGSPWYVCQIPARKGTKRALKDGVDWGYTKKRSEALSLSDYWTRQFRCDMNHVKNRQFCIHTDKTVTEC